jgi:hypothetical protein
MPARKRGRGEMEVDEAASEPRSIPSVLTQIRNMWEFASLMQYLFFFGKAVKLDDIDVEVGLYSFFEIKSHLSLMEMLSKARECGVDAHFTVVMLRRQVGARHAKMCGDES